MFQLLAVLVQLTLAQVASQGGKFGTKDGGLASVRSEGRGGAAKAELK